MEDRVIKVILPASEIPLGSTVTKRTGSSEYTIADSITIHKEGGGKQVIKAEDGNRFLMPDGDSRSISSVSGSTELCWLTDFETLKEYLDNETEDHK